VELSGPSDLFSLLGEEVAAEPNPEESPSPTGPKRAPRLAKKRASGDEAAASEAGAVPVEATNRPTEPAVSPGRDDRLLLALPALDSPESVGERAVEILTSVDPAAAGQIPPAVPFPPEDDPFTRTAGEWEAVWYASRESALRVYLNARMEFRRQLARAAAGEPHDLRPWSYWAFTGPRPNAGEPVYGLTEARRQELAWAYSGPATDFVIYRPESMEEA
jgi:hypothetical protein